MWPGTAGVLGVRTCTSDRRCGAPRKGIKRNRGGSALLSARCGAWPLKKLRSDYEAGVSPRTAGLRHHPVLRERACQGESKDSFVQKERRRFADHERSSRSEDAEPRGGKSRQLRVEQEDRGKSKTHPQNPRVGHPAADDEQFPLDGIRVQGIPFLQCEKTGRGKPRPYDVEHESGARLRRCRSTYHRSQRSRAGLTSDTPPALAEIHTGREGQVARGKSCSMAEGGGEWRVSYEEEADPSLRSG